MTRAAEGVSDARESTEPVRDGTVGPSEEVSSPHAVPHSNSRTRGEATSGGQERAERTTVSRRGPRVLCSASCSAAIAVPRSRPDTSTSLTCTGTERQG